MFSDLNKAIYCGAVSILEYLRKLTGLHLKNKGADVCCREISRDRISYKRPALHNLSILFSEDIWSLLTNAETIRSTRGKITVFLMQT